MKNTTVKQGSENFDNVLEFIKNYFSVNKTDWMIVSGMAVYLNNNPNRKPTDIDVIVNKDSLTEIENILSRSNHVDHLRRVHFISKFGLVWPLGQYLEMQIMGINVHISHEWIWKLSSGKIVRLPFDADEFAKAKLVRVGNFEVKVARPELIFLCKSISSRKFVKNGITVNKDLNDCKLLVSRNPDFDINRLKTYYDNLGVGHLYNKIALPLVSLYNRPK